MRKMPRRPYWGFNIEKAMEHLNADKFLGEFCVKNKDGGWVNMPVAMFYSENPDTSKGHKNYPFLYLDPIDGQLFVSALDKEQMDEQRKVRGVYCTLCDSAFFSQFRHDYVNCECDNEAFVDGGRDYFKAGAKDMTKVIQVEFDLIDDTITELRKVL